MQYLVENGVSAGVMMAPLLPGITDDEENIQAVVEAAQGHKAQYLGANVLFLKPGSKEWIMPMLREAYPHLTPGYNRLYHKTYAPGEYTKSVMDTVDRVRRRWGLPDRATVQRNMSQRGQLALAFTA
jgi:DNA repair photolyase